MDNTYRLLDLILYGHQEPWEDSPPLAAAARGRAANLAMAGRQRGGSDDLCPG